MTESESRVGLGTKRVGYGETPALIVVDLQNGLTHADEPMGSDLSGVIEQTNELAAAAREKDVPIVYSRHVPYPGNAKVGIWAKVERLENLDPELWTGQLDDRLNRQESDYVVDKSQPSVFHETEVDSMLTAWGVDTTIVTGCSTSGCIRATTIDTSSAGYRTIVPEPCVGDRSQEQHEAHISDIDVRIGDVVDVEDVLDYFDSL